MSDVKGKRKIILKFNLDNFKDMKTIDDFFTKIGLVPYLKEGMIHDVRQMEMNDTDCKAILDYWLSNWRKVKELKGYRKTYAQSRISFTWMNYSPCSVDECPRGELWIYPKKKHKEEK